MPQPHFENPCCNVILNQGFKGSCAICVGKQHGAIYAQSHTASSVQLALNVDIPPLAGILLSNAKRSWQNKNVFVTLTFSGHLYIRGEGRREKNMNPREKTNQLIILHVGICNMSMLTGILVQSPSVQSDGAAGMARGSCIIV